MASLEENKALVRRWWDETNTGNLDIIDELCAPTSPASYSRWGRLPRRADMSSEPVTMTGISDPGSVR